MTRVCIVNCYNDDNKGSAALTLAAIHAAEQAFAASLIHLVPLSGEGGADSFRHTLASAPDAVLCDSVVEFDRDRLPAFSALSAGTMGAHWHSSETAVDAIRGADVVLSRGGVVLHSRESGLKGTISLASRLSALAAARRFGVPYILLGAQVGPVSSAHARAVLRPIVRRASRIMVRDQRSLLEVMRFKPKEIPHTVPDSVFGLAAPSTWQEKAGKVLGAVVSSHSTLDLNAEVGRVAGAVVTAASALAVEGIRFFIHSTGPRSDDRLITEMVAESVSRSARGVPIVVEYSDLSPAQLMAEYAACAAVISSRLHAVILAFAAGSIGISLPTGVTFKERAVLSEVGLGRFVPENDYELSELMRALASESDALRDDCRGLVRSAKTRLASEVRSCAALRL